MLNSEDRGGSGKDQKGKGDGKKKDKGPSAPAGGGEGGLLVRRDGKVFGKLFLFAVLLEFLGLMLFTLFGSVTPYPFGAVGNGLILAVLVYITANVSGGHLNPAVTLPAMMTGHISIIKGFLYIAAQIGGAMIGSLLVAGLVPGSKVGQTSFTCFQPGNSASKGQAFAWEFFMTFVLVATVYAVAIGKPSFGNVGPLIVGIALWACASCAGAYTGASLNPARTLGPATVFSPCHSGDVWYYVLAELLGGLMAGLLSMPLYGRGPDFAHAVDHDSENGSNDNHNDNDTQEEGADDWEQHTNTPNGERDTNRNPAFEHQHMLHGGSSASQALADHV